MTQDDLTLVVLMEEASEVAQAVSKILRFGFAEVYPKRGFDNAEFLARELDDLLAMAEILRERGLLRASDPEAIRAKKAKVIHWEAYSELMGRLDP